MRKFFISGVIICFIALFGCGPEVKEINIDNIKLNTYTIGRLDNELFALTPQNFAAERIKLQKKYGKFFNIYLFSILNRGDAKSNDSIQKVVDEFIHHKDMREVYDLCQTKFKKEEIEKLSEDLTTSFKYYKACFPNQKIPVNIVTFISGFNSNIYTTDSTLAIGLEAYLGSDNKFYEALQLSKYQTHNMNKEYILSDAMRGWWFQCFNDKEPVNNLANHMVFYGKLYYALDMCLPGTADSIKFGYTTAQMDYLAKYEKKLWAYFTEKDKLYKNDLREVTPYVSDGPFTSQISKECPPRIAMWVGRQVVKAYMAKNPNVSMQQLMDETDVLKIITKSKYKP